MSKSAPGDPTFSWSHSRDQLLRSCTRRYYYRYYLAHGGWHRNANPASRRAYALTQLTTLELALGTSLHARAREIASAIVSGLPRPTPETLRERVRADLNQLYHRSRDQRAFLRDPRGHPILLSAYYARGVSESLIEGIRERMDQCLGHLLCSEVWAALETCPAGTVHVIDAPAVFQADQIPTWVAPDLVYTPPGDRTTIVDWKTGKEDVSAAEQLCLYAWYVRDVLGLPQGRTGYEGRVVELATGTEWIVDLTADAIEDARRRVHASVATMRALLEAPDYVRPKPITSFPLTPRRARCPGCNYWEMCEGEIRSPCASARNALDDTDNARSNRSI